MLTLLLIIHKPSTACYQAKLTRTQQDDMEKSILMNLLVLLTNLTYIV